MMRYKKYKRGTPLEITEWYGGHEEKTIGYYWMNDATNRRIVLMSSLPPLKLNGNYLEKRYCSFDMIVSIRELSEKYPKIYKEYWDKRENNHGK